MIKIHKEGRLIFAILSSILLFITLVAGILLSDIIWLLVPLIALVLFIIVFVARFFRVPKRETVFDDGLLYSPADGKIVVIEETIEDEYFKDRRLQVSVFMSVWDVHINFFPFTGKVKYFKYHPGKFLLAINPKSSTLNERTTVVVENNKGIEVLIRQIAGAVARRVVCYAKNDKVFNAGDELGFIKFGSRADIFLPLGTEILVKPGEQVFGKQTPLARLKSK